MKSSILLEVARYIESHADEALTLADLADRFDLNAATLSRRFKARLGMTPRAFHRAIRDRLLREELRRSPRVTDAIYAAGYGSVSRVYEDGAQYPGMSLRAYHRGAAGEQIRYLMVETRFGRLGMAATPAGVCLAEFVDCQEALKQHLMREFPNAELSVCTAADPGQLTDWIHAVEQWLDSQATIPDIPLDLKGTVFQISVWQLLRGVREGETLSYSELAQRLGRPQAVRAVASACARNRVALLIPCHRVLRADGSLGGYRWGSERKRALLEKEAFNRVS